MIALGGNRLHRMKGRIFIAGYLDCAAYDLGETKPAEAQWNVIEPKITTYYASHSGSTLRTVPSLILILGVSSHSTDRAAERHPGKHGIFDGDYWRQITPSGRVGFVEGYVTCRDSKPEQKRFTVHSPAWYVGLISEHYHLTADDDIDDSHASEKIATIIQEHAKQSSGSKESAQQQNNVSATGQTHMSGAQV